MPKESETTDLDSNVDCKGGAYPNLAYGGRLAFVSVWLINHCYSINNIIAFSRGSAQKQVTADYDKEGTSLNPAYGGKSPSLTITVTNKKKINK